MRSLPEIVDIVALVISAGYGIFLSINPSKCDFDARFVIPICLFSALHFAFNIVQHYFQLQQNILKIFDCFVDPFLFGCVGGIALMALITGAWSHKLIKAPQPNPPKR